MLGRILDDIISNLTWTTNLEAKCFGQAFNFKYLFLKPIPSHSGGTSAFAFVSPQGNAT